MIFVGFNRIKDFFKLPVIVGGQPFCTVYGFGITPVLICKLFFFINFYNEDHYYKFKVRIGITTFT